MDLLHYAPPANWMNDPNGLVFHNGRYHLFFQYNPEGHDHANMSWGHASSPDLVRWEDHPVAIAFDADEDIFSGSVVADEEGTAGFGKGALLAFYTSHSKRAAHQAQSIAYSIDDGETWAKYEGNPVLDRGSSDFRDPKVVRYTGPGGPYWVLVAVEAIDQQVLFYRSDDLLTWTFLSAFGPEAAAGGIWECPDLFPLRVGDGDDVAWVLLVSTHPGGPAGGSATQYFVGDFDGVTFTPHVHRPPIGADDEGMRSLPWLDHGHDCYAGVTFSGLGIDDRILIAWMSNWLYAAELPVDPAAPQRGAMTMARRLSLVDDEGTLRLVQVGIGPEVAETATITAERIEGLVELPLTVPPVARIDLLVDLGGADGFALALGRDRQTCVELRYERATGRLLVDRSRGAEALPASYSTQAEVTLGQRERVGLTIWLDAKGIEVFADGGRSVITDLTPSPPFPHAWLEGVGGAVTVEKLTVSG